MALAGKGEEDHCEICPELLLHSKRVLVGRWSGGRPELYSLQKGNLPLQLGLGLQRNELEMLQPEQERTLFLHLVQWFPPLAPHQYHLGNLKNSWYPSCTQTNQVRALGVGPRSVFLKIGTRPIHTKLRSTIDYSDLNGLTEEKTDYELSTSQVPSNHQWRTHHFSKQL